MMLDSQLTLGYWLRRSRLTTGGLIPISLRLTIKGVRCDLATGLSCPAIYWNDATKQLLLPADKVNWVLPAYSPAAVDELNDELYQLKREVRDLYKRMRQPDPRGPLVEVTAEDVRLAMRSGGTETKEGRAKSAALRRPLLDMARQFMDILQDVPKADRLADSTLENYESRLNALKRYLKTECSSSFPAAEVDVPWCRRYERWLVSEAGGFGSAAMRKQVNFLQLTLNYAVAEGWLPVPKLHGYKYQTRPATPLALSLPAEEVAKLATVLPDFCDAEQRAVTGWLFCCYTGLSWVDYGHFCASPASYLFTERPSGPGEQPTYWLRMVRQKMKRRKPQGFSVPLFDEAAELLVRWRGRLPWTNDVNINKLLHRVEAELGLSQSLTTKLARATFSQLKRDEGYSDEAVAAMMGDSVAVMNRHYSRVSERRVALEMSKLTPAPVAASMPTSTLPAGPLYPIVEGPGCANLAQALPIVPRLVATRRRVPAANQWRRPAPVTSYDTDGPRVVPLWAEPTPTTTRREAASA